MSKSRETIARLMREITSSPIEHPVPEGWSDANQIRVELDIAHTRNASSRARELFKRGLLERKPHRSKAGSGQCNTAYIYRPVKPYVSIKDASDSLFKHHAEAVPAGWVRIIDYAVKIKCSDVSVRSKVVRHGIKPKYYKTPRGIIGLHLNAFYKESELDGVFLKPKRPPLRVT